MRAFLRRHRLGLAVTAVFSGLTANVWVQEGAKPLLFVLAAVAGYVLVLGSVFYVTGSQVVRHARREATAIETGTHPARELTR